MEQIVLKRSDEAIAQPQPWGELIWHAGRALNNSGEMTVGRCILNPGQANPPHSHPNCSEILVVQEGHIMHTFNNGEDVEMKPGDAITIPAGIKHNARNIGAGRAELIVIFSSADRQTRGE